MRNYLRSIARGEAKARYLNWRGFPDRCKRFWAKRKGLVVAGAVVVVVLLFVAIGRACAGGDEEEKEKEEWGSIRSCKGTFEARVDGGMS